MRRKLRERTQTLMATFDFLDLPRQTAPYRPVADRIRDDLPVELPLLEPEVQIQARRCMDCGVPFCQSGCPLGNPIPDFNAAVREGRWDEAFAFLSQTNTFPEFTGRICPAPCESACVLGLAADPVTIEQIERTISDRAYREGWVQPVTGIAPTGKSVAVVGSGPAGLAAADQLVRAGHAVTVYERDDRPGGLLRYGVPDFKLAKEVLDRRLKVMRGSGVAFVCGVSVGDGLAMDALRDAHDAIVLCTGATRAREVSVPGRQLDGIHPAWDYLTSHAKAANGSAPGMNAAGKHVVVIGGGDTASDCVGVAHRQGAASVVSFQILSQPPPRVPRGAAWPFRSPALTTSSSHQEGGERIWSVNTTAFEGEEGHVTSVRTLDAEVSTEGGRFDVREIEGTERIWQADLVIIAIGYAGPETGALVAQAGVSLDPAGRIAARDYMTSEDGIFAAGDARRGASLVVWALSEGREAAREVDRYLMGTTGLSTKGAGDLARA